jgi:DNA/RNA-binding domain of Phe-tRNA-synthetase-like protein
MTHKLIVEDAIFKALPKTRVFLAAVRNIDPNQVDKDGIGKLLEESWNSAREQIASKGNVQSHPNIQLWRQAFQSLKVSTKKYTSSVESLAKRASKADSKPFSINPLVDFYNAFSLKYLVPFGGFDMETDMAKVISLRFSKEGDKFLALDAEAAIDLPVGEALYASGNTVVTRHINWKQSKEGLIEAKSTNVCLMAEVLNGYPESQLADMQSEFKKCCVNLLHVEPEMYMLDEENASVTY